MVTLRPSRCLPALLLTVALSACSTFPELDETVSPGSLRADYPALVPAESLSAQVAEARITDQTTQSMEARVAALHARAARLRGTVIDLASRKRLDQKITIDVPQ